MIYYYISSLLLTLSAFFINRRIVLFAIPLIGSLFLYILPTTGYDYDHYQEAYNNSYLSIQFPWFYTNSSITAEPLYLWYNSFWGVILPYGFSFYLAINFVVCYLISILIFIRVKVSDQFLLFFWLSLLPVVFPTIFYFSPRSSISFFLILLGFIKLCENKIFQAIPIIFIGGMIHSQYLLVSVFILVLYFILKLIKKLKKSIKKRVIWLFSLAFLLLFTNIGSFIGTFESVLSTLPSASVATSKLHYFVDSRAGVRVTSILSVFLYPILVFYLLRYSQTKNKRVFFTDKDKDDSIIYLLIGIILLGAIINIVFFNSAHLAGRLSRFSDYVGVSIITPIALLHLNKKFLYIFLFTMAFIAPVIYPTIYNL